MQQKQSKLLKGTKAEAEAAKQAAELAKAAAECVAALEKAGLVEESKTVQERLRKMLEGGVASSADLADAARSAHELAVKLQSEGKVTEADEIEKLVQLLDTAAKMKTKSDEENNLISVLRRAIQAASWGATLEPDYCTFTGGLPGAISGFRVHCAVTGLSLMVSRNDL